MPQGLQSASFFINKVIFVALRPISLLLLELQILKYDRLKPSLLSSNSVNRAPYVKFYINNIFSEKESS